MSHAADMLKKMASNVSPARKGSTLTEHTEIRTEVPVGDGLDGARDFFKSKTIRTETDTSSLDPIKENREPVTSKIVDDEGFAASVIKHKAAHQGSTSELARTDRIDDVFRSTSNPKSRARSTAGLDQTVRNKMGGTGAGRSSYGKMPANKHYNVPARRLSPQKGIRTEKAYSVETYHNLQDENLKIKNAHNTIKDDIKQVTTKLMTIESKVRRLEDFSGDDDTEYFKKLIQDNENLKKRVNELTMSLGGMPKTKKGKKLMPSIGGAAGTKYEKSKERKDHMALIANLRGALKKSDAEVQRLKAEKMGTLRGTMGGAGIDSRIREMERQNEVLNSKNNTLEEKFKLARDESDRMRKQWDEMNSQLRDAQSDKITLESENRSLKRRIEGNDDLVNKYQDAVREKTDLERRLNELLDSPFIREAGDRNKNIQKYYDMDDQLGNSKEKMQKLMMERDDFHTQNVKLRDDVEKLIRDRDMQKEEAMRVRLQLEQKEKSADLFEEQMKFFSKASESDQNAFRRALGMLKLQGDEPAWSRLQFLDDASKYDPADLKSCNSEINRLKIEKGKLAAELEKAQTLLRIQQDINKEQSQLAENEKEQLKGQLQASSTRADQLARLADHRASRMIQMQEQQKVDQFDRAGRIDTNLGGVGAVGTGAAIDGPDRERIRRILHEQQDEFLVEDDETEIGPDENVLDLWLGEAQFSEGAISQILGATGLRDPAGILSFCTVDFYNYDTQSTPVCEGIKPRYNLYVSFKITVDTFFVQYLESESVVADIYFSRGQEHIKIGQAKIDLKPLLTRPDNFGSMNQLSQIIQSGAAIMSLADGQTSIGLVNYKLRMRYPISEAIKQYKERKEIIEVTRGVYDVATRYDPEEFKGYKNRKLIVSILNCSGLVGSSVNISNIAPYVYYQFFTFDEHFTSNRTGPDPHFDDTKVFMLKMDGSLQTYLDKESLEFLVFDDNAPFDDRASRASVRASMASGVGDRFMDYVGSCQLPLSNLLISEPIQGYFPLYNKKGESAGSLQIRVYWEDSTSSFGGTPLTKVWEQEICRKIAGNLKQRGLTVESAYNIFDSNQDGYISADEFSNTLNITLQLQVSQQEIQLLLSTFMMETGRITKREFIDKFGAYLGSSVTGTAGTEGEMWEGQVYRKIWLRMKERNISIAQAFTIFDVNRDNFISPEEFRYTFQKMQMGLAEEEISRLIQKIDKDAVGRISYPAFEAKLRQFNQESIAEVYTLLERIGKLIVETGNTLSSVFERIDHNGDGQVSRQQFNNFWELLKLNLTPTELDQLWQYFDSDSSGMITLTEFRAAFSRTSSQMSISPGDKAATVKEKFRRLLQEYNITVSEAFKAFDTNKDGVMSRHEFRELIISLKIQPLTSYDIEELVKVADPDRNDKIYYREFLEFFESEGDVIKMVAAAFRKAGMTIMQAFNFIDKNHDGRLSKSEFRDAFRKTSLGLTNYQIERMFKIADVNGDGVISVREFIAKFDEDIRGKIPGDAGFERSPTRHSSSISRGLTRHDTNRSSKEFGRSNTLSHMEKEGVFQKIGNILKEQDIPIATAFEVFDENGDGFIDKDEFVKVFQSLKIDGVGSTEIAELWKHANKVDNRRLSYKEFIQAFGLSSNSQEETIKVLRSLSNILKKENISLEDAFKGFDSNGDGRISMDEFKTMFRQMRFQLSEIQIRALMKELDTDENGMISYYEFLKAFSNKTGYKVVSLEAEIEQTCEKLRSKLSQTGVALHTFFDNIDDRDTGKIPKAEFKRSIGRINNDITSVEITNLAEYMDKDKDGYISYKEFEALMTKTRSQGLTHSDTMSSSMKRAKRTAKEIFEELAQYQKVNGMSSAKLFQRIDTNGSGSVDAKELYTGLQKLKISATQGEVRELMKESGKDKLNYQAFKSLFDRHVDRSDFSSSMRDSHRDPLEASSSTVNFDRQSTRGGVGAGTRPNVW